MASAIYKSIYEHIYTSSLQGTICYDKIVLKSFEKGVEMEFLCTFHG